MSRLFKGGCKIKYIGLVVASIGLGVVLTVVIPLWGWIIGAGCGLIYVGWYIIEHHH